MGEVNKTNNYTEFYYHFFRNILLVGIPVVIISAIILSSLHSSATGSGSGTDSLTISISSACTLSSVIDSEHNASINAGTYKDDIGKTTIKTTCNDNNGYSIYANGYSNNKEGNNRLINTLSPSNVIETGLNTSGDTSSWAMKLNNIPDDPSPTPPVIESAYDDTYGIIPSNWTKVLSLPSGSTDMSLGSSFTTTYAVYANSRQYTGTYQGQVKYLLTHPYSTDEYIYYMQEVDAWKNTLGMAQSVQAIDKRDGKKYWVTKLQDGHIWMTQNLDFDISANTTFNSNTTDLNVIYNASTGQYAEYSDGYTESNGIIYYTPASTATTIDFTGTTVTGWKNSDTVPYSANKTDDTEIGHASLGNYYNWTVAIASNNSSSLRQGTSSDISNNPKNSICPKGWRLPTISDQSETLSGSTNEFARLGNLYGVSNVIYSPIYFTKSGNAYNASLENTQNGYYWSSTISGAGMGKCADIINGVLLNAQHGNSNGFPLRCVAR